MSSSCSFSTHPFLPFMDFKRTPFPLIIFFIILTCQTLSLQNFEACAPKSCGKGPNISYPFWIAHSQSNFCGLPSLDIACKDENPVIRISEEDYIIREISYENHSFLLTNAVAYDATSPTPLHNFSLHRTPFTYNSDPFNFFFFYNCTSLPPNYSYPVDWYSTSELHSFAALNDGSLGSMKSSYHSCQSSVKVPVDLSDDEVKYIQRLFMKSYFDVLKIGFTLNWSAQNCSDCETSGGRCGFQSNEFVCFCSDGSHLETCKKGKLDIWKRAIIGASALGTVILIISIVIISIYYTRKGTSNKDKIEESIRSYSTQTPKRYRYSELKKFTNSFKNKLGQGGFSTVYKGKLSDGRDVAVKLLNESSENAQDFMNEVVSITRTSHINIASLLGFCYERKSRALIYEYMSRGSLDKYISHHKGPQRNNIELDWSTLYSIIIGVARGLEYLHRGCNTRILHFDIKPHNILLDSDFCPKISDFGLAKQCKARESHVSMTGVKGTVGFIAPEVIFRNFGKVSHKSDVYSYGMLVLEMMGARKNPNDGVEQRSEEYFPDWIYKDLTQSEIDGGCWWGNTEEEDEMARKMIIVGLHCIQTLPDDRPSMTDVVVMLEGDVGLQIPPKPKLFGPPTIEQAQPSSSSSNWISNDSLIF